MKQRKEKPERKPRDWRKDMEGVTLDQLAKALLRPIRRGNTSPRHRRSE